MTDPDIDYLASDLPLSLYVLFEAAHDMNGRRLGALGSLILAETLYKALAASRPSDVLVGTSAECEFSKLARVVYGHVAHAPRLARCVPHIETIPDLLAFVAPTMEKQEMALPFL